MDDSKAIRRLKEGDIGGLELLIARYQNKAVRVAYLLTHDLLMAEDVVQETLIRIYERICHYDETRPFEPYFLRSVVNTALNVIKKTSHWIVLDEEVEPGVVEGLIHQAASTEDQVEYTLLKQQIFEVLRKLPPRQRTVIVQRYYLEMSEKEMSEALKVAPGTIKWLLNRARQRLRKLIGLKGMEE